MGLFGSPGLDRLAAARRSIRFTFAKAVVAPAVALVAVWAATVVVLTRRALAKPGVSAWDQLVLTRFAVAVGISLVLLLLLAAVLAGSFARRVAREVAALEATAKYLSDDQLTQIVGQLRQGERLALPGEGPLRPLMRIGEIARAGQAIASLQHTAVTAAVGEARLRNGIGDVFVSLARRNQSLLQKQLRMIDELEQKAASPDALADLFPLDHLTTRMRRQAESLIILSGAALGRSWSEPVEVIDVIRGAIAEIEHYQRVDIRASPGSAVVGSAVADTIHLLAELIENAAVFSPPATRVAVRGQRVVNGYAVEIEDRGLGVKPTQLGVINQWLANPPDFDLANADQLGIFVVGKLAARHHVQVALRPSGSGGTTAVVLLPASIVVPAPAGQHREGPGHAPSGFRDHERRLGRTEPPLPARRAPRPPAAAQDAMGTSSRSSVPPARQAADPLPVRARAAAAGTPAPGTAGPGTYRGLPRRVRQASLSPHLKDSPPVPPGDAAAGPAGRTPEQARDLAAAMQNGWRRGRDADPAATQTGTAVPVTGPHETEVPGSGVEP